jgi:hypothetical protein
MLRVSRYDVRVSMMSLLFAVESDMPLKEQSTKFS